jgi:hypothetical protein
MQLLISRGASTRWAAEAALETAVTPPDADDLLEAALDLDATAIGGLLDRHLRHHGVVDTWERLIRPAFAAIEIRQTNGGGCIDVEHVLSWAVVGSLQRVPAMARAAHTSIILACTESETHTLVLEVLRAALCERNQAALMLGAGTPANAVIDALNRQRLPATVVLSSQTQHSADITTVQALIRMGANVLVAGPGWETVATPAEATWVNGLEETLRRLPASP